MAELVSARIYDDVVCLPSDVCRIIADYATRRPHAWRMYDPAKPDQPVILPTQTGLQSETMLIAAAVLRTTRIPNLPEDATAFVSTSTFIDADDEIDIIYRGDNQSHRWIGVGLMASKRICFAGMAVWKADKPMHLWFRFDTVGQKAFVRSRDVLPGHMRFKCLTRVKPTSRLCIILRGLGTEAVVRCGPRSDRPVDGPEKLVFNFDDNGQLSAKQCERLLRVESTDS
jgi:hypothetical protein